MIAETSVDMLHNEKTAIWYSSHPATIRKMKKLKEEYPDDVKVVIDHAEGLSMGDEEEEVEIDRDELSYEIEIPRKWMRLPKPPAKREMTEEHKEKIQKALREYRANKKSEAGK